MHTTTRNLNNDSGTKVLWLDIAALQRKTLPPFPKNALITKATANVQAINNN